MNQSISFVNFNANPIMTVRDERTGVVYIPLKPICEIIGVAWQSQLEKIKQDEVLSSTITEIVIVANDGKQREMTCLPLEFLNGWLFKLNPSKVAPEVKGIVIKYQRECYKVLAAHFQGQPVQRIPLTKAELALEYQKLESRKTELELRKTELQVKKLELSFKLPENQYLSHGQIQVITDAIADSFCEGKAENNRDKWIGCAQLAEEMGYKITASNRTKLGKFLMNYELDRKQEHRLCNGQCRVINIYRECDELRDAIAFFFELN